MSATTSNIRPFSFRLPKSGVDPLFGLSRSAWNELVLPRPGNGFKPKIKSRSIKKPGAKRGVRVIFYESAREWFETQDGDQNFNRRDAKSGEKEIVS